jgi:hypothetical protein
LRKDSIDAVIAHAEDLRISDADDAHDPETGRRLYPVCDASTVERIFDEAAAKPDDDRHEQNERALCKGEPSKLKGITAGGLHVANRRQR